MGKEGEVIKSSENEKLAYDVVVVLGGNIRKSKDGSWKTTSYIEGDEKSIGAHARTLAAAELYKQGKAKNFIVCTGVTTTLPGTNVIDSSAPSEAFVMKQEMVRYGIPKENIILEEESTTTLTNAIEAAKILKQHPEFARAGILTSFWHLERAMVMIESQRLDIFGKSIFPLNADEIIAKRSRRHKKIVSEMKDSDTTKKE